MRRWSNPIFAVLLSSLAVQASCVQRSRPSSLTNEQARTWADADIVLSKPDADYQLMLQTFSSPWEITQDTKFNLFAVREHEGTGGKRFNVFYADEVQPGAYRSMTYQLETYVGHDRRTIEVYAWIFQPTPSHERALREDQGQGGIRGPYSEAQRVYIGQAYFGSNNDRVVPMRMFNRLARSPAILYGPKNFKGNGHVAIHFIPNVVYKDPPAEALCPDEANCNTLPLAELCRNDVLNASCRPAKPPQSEWAAFKIRGRTERLAEVGDGVFLLDRNQSSGRLVFTSQNQAATGTDNEKLCETLVTYLVRDGSGKRNNAACRIQKEASSTPHSGLMSCMVDISFVEPKDVHEFACNVTAVIRGLKKEFQTVQVLYRAR